MINVIPTIVLAALTGDAEGQTVLGGEERSLSLGSSFVDLLTGGAKKPAKPAKDITTTDGPEKGAKCKFPFTLGLTTYHDCTPLNGQDAANYPGKAWCATDVDFFGNYVKGSWGICPVTACKDSSFWGRPNKVDCICKASSSQNKDISTVCSKEEYCRHGATREKDLCSKIPECEDGTNLDKCDCMLKATNTVTHKNGHRVFKQTCDAGWKCNTNATVNKDICTPAGCKRNMCKGECVSVTGSPRQECRVNKNNSSVCSDIEIKDDGESWSKDACGKVKYVSTQTCGGKNRLGRTEPIARCKCRTSGGSSVRSDEWVLTKRYGKTIRCERHVRCDYIKDSNRPPYPRECVRLPRTLSQKKITLKQ